MIRSFDNDGVFFFDRLVKTILTLSDLTVARTLTYCCFGDLELFFFKKRWVIQGLENIEGVDKC